MHDDEMIDREGPQFGGSSLLSRLSTSSRLTRPARRPVLYLITLPMHSRFEYHILILHDCFTLMDCDENDLYPKIWSS